MEKRTQKTKTQDGPDADTLAKVRELVHADAFETEDRRKYLPADAELIMDAGTPCLVCSDPNAVFSRIVADVRFLSEEHVIKGSDNSFVSMYTRYETAEPTATIYFRWRQQEDYRFRINLSEDVWMYRHPVFASAYVQEPSVGV